MAKALGVTFQQVQKYEHGRSRIPASRLYHLAELLRVPLATFFVAQVQDDIHFPKSPSENYF